MFGKVCLISSGLILSIRAMVSDEGNIMEERNVFIFFCISNITTVEKYFTFSYI